jgi:hypothetical protein
MKGLESSFAGFGRPGVPPIIGQQYPPGIQEKYNSFQERIPVMKDDVKDREGVRGNRGFPL